MKTLAALLISAAALAAPPPQASISNGLVNAVLNLPDPSDGYYRATRFDWSGVIASLEFAGHSYVSPWFPRYDPKLHDAITGPVEEFFSGDTVPAPGYADAPAGGAFLKIGVGLLRKPSPAPYNHFHTYDIIDSGRWTVHSKTNEIQFVQVLSDPATGYAYRYTKTVRLLSGRPRLVLEHRLQNTGKKPLRSEVYDHNFFTIDNTPTGPDFTLRFSFPLHAEDDLHGRAAVQDFTVLFPRVLNPGESFLTHLTGFGPTPRDYDIRIENHKTGAAARITADRPLSQLVLWGIRTVRCPEPYIAFDIPPGRDFRWTINYDFYTLPPTP